MQIKDPDVTVSKVYLPEHGNIQIHQRKIQLCPLDFPAGFYWYGGRSVGPGHPPEWVNKLLAANLPLETRNQTQSNVNLILDGLIKNVPDYVEPSESCKEEDKEESSDRVDNEQEQDTEDHEQGHYDFSECRYPGSSKRTEDMHQNCCPPPIRYRL